MQQPHTSPNVPPEEVAIIGMSCRFPGATTIEEFWENLCNGVESISLFSDTQLELSLLDPMLATDPNLVKAGAVLEEVDLFDAKFFDLTPAEAKMMDPQHRLFLECCWEALEHAAYMPEQFGGSIGVYAGATTNTYMLNLYANSSLVSNFGTAQVGIGNNVDFLTAQVAYRMNLTGPSVTVQTACSTSLVAVHVACQALLHGECDIALAGGVSIRVPQRTGYRYQPGGMLSPDGHCRAFDANAQGTVFGNGVGVVMLKRLGEALADGDTIHAVIKGSAVNNDGAVKVGFTAPRIDGQAAVIAEALSQAGIASSTLGYIEGHGTGTALGDPIEVTALTQAFQQSTEACGFCALGSVKTNIGHLDAAAGVAGLIKVVLMVQRGWIPPSLHCVDPTPQILWNKTPFYVNQRLVPWMAGEQVRRAGVSSFGLGGTNAHVVVEEAPKREPSGSARPWHLIVLSARTQTALMEQKRRLAETMTRESLVPLADVAYTLQVGRRSFEHRWAAVCRTREEAEAALKCTHNVVSITNENPVSGSTTLWFLFPGTVSEMRDLSGSNLYEEVGFREAVERCLAAVDPSVAAGLRRHFREGMSLPRSSTLTLFVWEYALAELWRSWGVCPDAMVGEGVGEYVGASLAGVMQVEEALQVVQWWGEQPSGGVTAGDVSTAFVDRFRNIQLAPPQRPYRSSVTGQWLTEEEATNVVYWARLLGQPASWETALHDFELERQRVLVEVGVGAQLACVNKVLAQARCPVVVTLLDGRPIQHALAELWVRGVPVDWHGYATSERRHRVALPTYPFERQRHWIEAPKSVAQSTPEAQRTQLTDWFYVPSWKRAAVDGHISVSKGSGPWMVFGHRSGFAEEFVAHLRRIDLDVLWVEPGDEFRQVDERHFCLRPGYRADYDRLLMAASPLPQRVVHMWSVSEKKAYSGTPSVELGFYSLLYLAQALEEHDRTHPNNLELSVISTGLHEVTGCEVLQADNAMVLGPCKVIPQEIPGIRCRSLDIELGAGELVQSNLITQIMAELNRPVVEPVVALRGHHRWVQTFESVRIDTENFSERQSQLRQNGVYLITGGLGRFGQIIAEHLARTVHAKLILTTRTGLPSRESWDDYLVNQDSRNPISSQIQAVRRMEALGAEVLVIGADVADYEQMQTVFSHAISRFGVLHGVVHAAGIDRVEVARALAHSTREICEEVFRPKVQGLCVLERILDGSTLDFFLVTSSLSPILGGLGLTAYAAANLFMDAYVCARWNIKGGIWKTINWEGWSAPEYSSYSQSLGADLKRMFMQDHEITECFERVLSINAPQVVVATGHLQPRIDEWVKLQSLDNPRRSHPSYVSRRIALTPATESIKTIEHTVLDLTSSLLGLEDLRIDDDLFEVGGNSLMAVQLVARLQDQFGVQIPLRVLFEQPTVAELARFIKEREVRLPSLRDWRADASLDGRRFN